MNGVASQASFPGDAGLEAEQMLIDMRDQILSGTVDIEKEMKNTKIPLIRLWNRRRKIMKSTSFCTIIRYAYKKRLQCRIIERSIFCFIYYLG